MLTMLNPKFGIKVFFIIWTLLHNSSASSERYHYTVEGDDVTLSHPVRILSLHNETIVQLPSSLVTPTNSVYSELKLLNKTKEHKNETNYAFPIKENISHPVGGTTEVMNFETTTDSYQNHSSWVSLPDSSNKPLEGQNVVIDEASSATLSNVSIRQNSTKWDERDFMNLNLLLTVLRNENVRRELKENNQLLSGNETDDSKSSESEINSDESDDSQQKEFRASQGKKKKQKSARQFVFHPYLPYEKEIAPDEKISFHDVLPVKMVKFIKSLVEEAPWEQMFMKMVRMIVDQFVDKIIEKMFAHKDDEHSKWRSLDVLVAPSWGFPTYSTPVVRLRRSTDQRKKDDPLISLVASNRMAKEHIDEKVESSEETTWLDSVLDYLFPEEPTKNSESRERREVSPKAKVLKELVKFFMKSFENSSKTLNEMGSDVAFKDLLRYKMLKDILPVLFQVSHTDSDPNLLPSEPTLSPEVLSRYRERSGRHKRSLDGKGRRTDDEKRLWQATHKRRPANQRSRDECSLRKACNAGRLLSRLPSVQEITLQLRTYGEEPHWDALLWGMKRKRCSRIFCKRQRSPKGSKHPWQIEAESRGLDLVKSAAGGSEESIDPMTP